MHQSYRPPLTAPHAPAYTTVMLAKPLPSILCFISMGAVKRVDWGPSLPARGPAAGAVT